MTMTRSCASYKWEKNMQMICLPRRGRRGLNFPLLQARHIEPTINYELRLKMHCIRKMSGQWVVSLSYVMRVHLGRPPTRMYARTKHVASLPISDLALAKGRSYVAIRVRPSPLLQIVRVQAALVITSLEDGGTSECFIASPWRIRRIAHNRRCGTCIHAKWASKR